jgi:hypothetical protein
MNDMASRILVAAADINGEPSKLVLATKSVQRRCEDCMQAVGGNVEYFCEGI